MEHLKESFLAVEEHIIEATRLLGVHCMGIDPDATRREALDQLAMALTNFKTGQNNIWAERPAGLPNHLIDPRSTDALDIVLGTLKRCGFSKEIQKEVILAIAGGLDRAGAEDDQIDVTNGDVRLKTATEGVDPEQFARFKERERVKVSLLTAGEILTEETFLQTALGAVESILEMAPHVRQEGDGGPSLEDEAARAFSALRAALRCGTRSIEPVDIDDSDNLEAAQ